VAPLLLLLLSHPAWGQEEAPGKARPVTVRITSPRPLNGGGEWLPPSRDEGFLSTTPIACSAELTGEAKGVTIRWRAAVYRGRQLAGAVTGAGTSFTFRPADAARRQRSGPIAVEIVAEAVADERTQPTRSGTDPDPNADPCAPLSTDRVRIQQDEIDQIRQEYLDLPGRKLALAPREAFIDRSSYESQGALRIPWPDLNRSRRHDGGSYGYILLTEALREGLRRWQEQLGPRGLTISSGFRNPHKQRLTNSAARGSMHQYGRAVDVQASLRRDFRDWVQVAWAALDAGADYVETAPEGGWSHVHADWRHDGQGPALTVKLEITGRIVDAEGKPVAAQVLGASDAAGGLPGMPAWEGPDAEGRFVLRTVWRPGKPYRVRAWTDVESATQLVTVPDATDGVARLETELVLAPDPVRAALSRRRAVRLASRGSRRSHKARRVKARRS
jgi:hypothetical protein